MEDLRNGDVTKLSSSNGQVSESGTQNLQLTGVIANDKSEYSEKSPNCDDTELALIIDGNSLVYILEKDLESEV